ncbi:hypothetical protein LINPERHAP2_LOCUS31491, partial [Linum perenne]
GQAAAGGLIRGSVGRISAAYGVCLGVCSITRAELGAAVTDLLVAWEKGYQRVRVQLDSRLCS